MKLLVNNKEVSILSLAAQEALSQYYDYYLLTVPVRLTDVKKVDLVISKRETFYLLREDLVSTGYTYVLVPERTYKLLNSTFPSFTGTCTLIQLLNKLGFKHSITLNSGMCYWHIPSLKFTRLLDYLARYTVPAGGGAPYFGISLEGELTLTDLKLSFSRTNPASMSSYTFSSDSSYIDWMMKVPSEVTIYSYTSSGSTTEKFVIESGLGKGSVCVNDTTGHEVELVKRALTTSYYINKYTSRRASVLSGLDNYQVGDLVSVDDCVKFVIYSKASSIPLTDEPAQVSYSLVAAI